MDNYPLKLAPLRMPRRSPVGLRPTWVRNADSKDLAFHPNPCSQLWGLESISCSVWAPVSLSAQLGGLGPDGLDGFYFHSNSDSWCYCILAAGLPGTELATHLIVYFLLSQCSSSSHRIDKKLLPEGLSESIPKHPKVCPPGHHQPEVRTFRCP